jgi:hypothetical protein
MGSLMQQFTNIVAMNKHIEQGIRSGKISMLTEKMGFMERGKMLIILRVAKEEKRTISKTTRL